jgi:hypothetical protein
MPSSLSICFSVICDFKDRLVVPFFGKKKYFWKKLLARLLM